MNTWNRTVLAEWERINRLATKRFRSESLAEEAALFVIDGLAEENWRRVRAFNGSSSPGTYIAALTHRLLEDFARKRFGRIRPPAWVRRLGGIWMALFQLLCLERHSPDEAVAIIKDRQSAAVTTLQDAAYTLLGEIPSCGERRGETTEYTDNTTLQPEEGLGSWQQEQLEQQEREQLLALLGRLFFGMDTSAPTDTTLFIKHIQAISFDLTPEETLLLQLCYRDGVPVAEAGRMLGMNRYQVHGRVRRLLQRIRGQIRDAGLEQDFRQFL
ncbi:MAG: hypothetical protein CSA33_08020 [Desulfobulbus propionicus]|nr:MAG: hypothetical protein CSA33_08020 [Desulfobulbus propionicus]